MNIIKTAIHIFAFAIVGTVMFSSISQSQAKPNHIKSEQFSCANVTEIPQIECEALVALYNKTDGPNWDEPTGWLVTNTPCSWYGVICSNRHVTEINLEGKSDNPFGLKGDIPSEIGNLSNLISLHIPYDNLNSIPAEISKLSNLIILSLPSSNLSSFPPGIWNLSELKLLSLNSNDLRDIPKDIRNLSNLTHLALRSNELSSVSAEISNLLNLTYLALSSDKLKSMPDEIGKLSNLTTLNLSANQLTHVPASINNLSKLTTLDLSYNRLANLHPDFIKLVGLTKLVIHSNHLTNVSVDLEKFLDEKAPKWADTQTPLETETITPVPTHTSIPTSTPTASHHFDCTPVSEISQIECEALVALYNRTEGPHWDDTTGWLMTDTPCSWYGVTCEDEHVTELNLAGERSNLFGLRGDIPIEIGNLSRVKRLDFSYNQLTGLPSSIDKLNNLIVFFLIANNLNNFPMEIWHLSNLKALAIESKNLQSVPEEIKNLSNLVILSLKSNELSSVSAKIGDLSNLTHLVLSSGKLKNVPTEIGKLSNLTMLDLSDNQLTSMPTEIGTLKSLTTLELSKNELGSLPVTISNLYTLTHLNLAANKLSRLPSEIGKLQNLTTLNLYSNQLTNVPAEISDLNNLIDLRLSFNCLTSLPSDFTNLVGLSELSIHNNHLTNLNTELQDFLDAKAPGWRNSQTSTCASIKTYTPTSTETSTPTPTPSPTVTLTPTETKFPAPAIPQPLTPLDGAVLTPGPITFTWQPAQQADTYAIELYRANGEKIANIENTLTQPEYVFALEIGDYSWWVESHCPEAQCKAPYSGWSQRRAFSVQAANTPTPTDTSTPNPTDTPEPTYTSTMALPEGGQESTPTPASPPYEPNDNCITAQQITIGDTPQHHIFHMIDDIDWSFFTAITPGTYRIEVDIPDGSKADVDLYYYMNCDDGFHTDHFTQSFAPGVRLDVTADQAGQRFYIKSKNYERLVAGPQVAYALSVRQLTRDREPNDEVIPGPAIVVAGRYRDGDHLQNNIHQSALAAYDLFTKSGRYNSDIFFLATDSNLPKDSSPSNVDGEATLQGLEYGITVWAKERLEQPNVSPVLTLYLVDHGGPDEFYIDHLKEETLTSNHLHSWLTKLEEDFPNLRVNVIIEACKAGSFIDPIDGSISKPNRIIITSSDKTYDAYASLYGARFSEHFFSFLAQEKNLGHSFQESSNIVQKFSENQKPWIDADGDGIPNTNNDISRASEVRITNQTFASSWPPYIADAQVVKDRTDSGIRLQVEVRHEHGNPFIEKVWGVIYPPNYVHSTGDADYTEENTLNRPDLETIVFTADNNVDAIFVNSEGIDFAQSGQYQVAIHAQSTDGLESRPIIMEIDVPSLPPNLPLPSEYAIHLPIIMR